MYTKWKIFLSFKFYKRFPANQVEIIYRNFNFKRGFTRHLIKVMDKEPSTNGLSETRIIDASLMKSENDGMDYRVIELKNGLRALLISDYKHIVTLNVDDNMSSEGEEESASGEEDSQGSDDEAMDVLDSDAELSSKGSSGGLEEKMSACALCIGVGSFSDPPDIPGLAHFLEHMVFMGSEKYPRENGFDEFIKKYGGSDNASTDCEHTTFYFECPEKALHEGMDRFSQFFISPLMKREAMTREREAIHSEFEMSLPSEESRKEQLLGSFAKKNYPAGKFLWGNMKTLRDNVDDEELYTKVHEFRKRHYSANRMTLAVQARLSLDTLHTWVEECFTNIPNNNLPPDDFTTYTQCFATQEFTKMYWVKPVKDIYQVQLTWSLPCYHSEYKSKPMEYVSWILGHEGKGSLLSYLRNRTWALECSAGNDESGFEHSSTYALFSISLNLTAEGLEHLQDVLASVFSYLCMIQKHGPDERIFNELATVDTTNFRYKTESPACEYVETMSESMHLHEPEHYLVNGDLYLEYNPKLIKEIQNCLQPSNVNIIIFTKDKTLYDQTEPWFGTQYTIQDIPQDWINTWKNSGVQQEFHMPEPNPYLTQDFSLYTIDDINRHPEFPVKIEDNGLLEIWYRQDAKFKLPVAYYSFHLISPLIHESAPNGAMLDLLSTFFRIKFTEDIYPANQAGLSFTVVPSDLGLNWFVSGYNEKLPLFFNLIVKLFAELCEETKLDQWQDLFEAVKSERSRIYYNLSIKPEKLVKMVRMSLLLEKYWSPIDKMKLLDNISLPMFQEFTRNFFKNLRIQCLIQGNITQQQAVGVCNKFADVIGCSPLLPDTLPKMRVAMLKPGDVYCRVSSINKSDSNSVVANYYQSGQGGLRTSCIIDLLMMIMDEPLFDTLRTKEQLGYDVNCMLRDTFSVLGFSVTVHYQSNKYNVDDVHDKMEQFVNTFYNHLKSLSKRELEQMKSSLCELKRATDLQLCDEIKRNYSELVSADYLFDRFQKEAKLIPEITQKELLTWYSSHVANGKSFKKLSVQVVGCSTNCASDQDAEMMVENEREPDNEVKITTISPCSNSHNFITDVQEYQASREFYPVKQ